jgi:hypothetical protein
MPGRPIWNKRRVWLVRHDEVRRRVWFFLYGLNHTPMTCSVARGTKSFKERPSPPYPASDCPTDAVHRGNDGRMWRAAESGGRKRWVRATVNRPSATVNRPSAAVNRPSATVNRPNGEVVASKAVAHYIVSTLKEQNYHSQSLVRLIFLFAGYADVEEQGIRLAMMELPMKIDTIYLVDIYQSNDVREKHAKALMQPHARHVETGTFGDLGKYIMNLPISKSKFTVCIGVHPQRATGLRPSNANANAILNVLRQFGAINLPQNANRFQKGLTLHQYMRNANSKEMGRFFRLWLCHFKQAVAFIWRDGNIYPVTCDALGVNVQRLSFEDLADLVFKVHRQIPPMTVPQ